MYNLIDLVICPVCGKGYVPAGMHSYRHPDTHKRVCSYHCMRKAQKEKEARLVYKKTRERKDI